MNHKKDFDEIPTNSIDLFNWNLTGIGHSKTNI